MPSPKPIEGLSGPDVTAFRSAISPHVEALTADEFSARVRSDELESSTPGASGASRVAFESGQRLEVLYSAGPIYFSRDYASGGGDEATQVAAMITKHSLQRRPLLIDRPVSLSTLAVFNGYCVILSEGDGLLNITGGGAGLRAREAFTIVGNWTAAPSLLVQYPSGTGSYITALEVNSTAYDELSAGDYVHLSDSVWNRFQYINGDGVLVADGGNGVLTNQTNLAETAKVIGKSDDGSTIYLDRALAEFWLYSASGTIAKLGNNPCVINVGMGGEISTTRDLMRLEGYVGADIDARIEANSSRGVMLLSCMGARVRAKVRDLRDDEANNSFGYGVCVAAGSTDCTVEVHARNVRHAYSDIIVGTATGLAYPLTFSGGVVRRISVTGEGISCTAATWDTHTFSDQVRFENIKAFGTHNTAAPGQPKSGLNCAVQARGTNVTIDGLETNLQVGIRYGVDACRNSRLEISNFRHRNSIPDGAAATSANSLLSFVGTRFAGSGSHKVNIRNSSLHNILYVGNGWNFLTVHNSEVNMGTSTSGFPGNTNSGCVTEYVNTTVRDPASMNVSTGLTFDGGKIVMATTNGFNLLDGAVLKSRAHGIEITGGGQIGPSTANAAYASTSIATGAVTFIYSGVWVDDARTEGTIRAFSNLSTGGTVTLDDITARPRTLGVQTRGNADFSFRAGRDRVSQRLSVPITQERTITLETIGAADGEEAEFFRSGGSSGGTFNWVVKQGSTTLATIPEAYACRFRFDGPNSNWRLTARPPL